MKGGFKIDFKNKQKFKDKTGIYAIINTVNKKFYIGQTSQNFQRRYLHHQWKLNNNCHDNQHLQKSWNKYGEANFDFVVLKVIDEKSKLDNAEIYYIDLLKKCNKCYNQLLGGGGRRGFKMKESTKRLIGEQNRQHMTGRILPEAVRRKMSQTRTGLPSTRHKITNIIDETIAFKIKELYVSGLTAKDISQILQVPYSVVSNIRTNNTWDNVIVKGWDEYISTRKTYSRLKKQDKDIIINKYNSGVPIEVLCQQYNKPLKAIQRLVL